MKIIKANCNGNSFLYIEHEYYNQINIKEICNKFNYDCDGVFFFHESKKGNYCINLFNKDGSVATFCGNGLICFAKIFMKDNSETNIYFNKKKYLLVKEENEVFLKIPRIIFFKKIENDLYLLNIGNNHLIRVVENIDLSIFKKDVKSYPNNNVSQLIIKDKVFIKTFERGVGFTTSCGSAAISAYYLLRKINKDNTIIDIFSQGGVTNILNRKGEMFITGKVEIMNSYETK